MFAILWRYRVAPGAEARFREIYGLEGDWARLFRRAGGFVRTELLDAGEGVFASLDYWESEADFEAFQAAFGDAYQALDAECEALTLHEERLGLFSVVG